MHLLLASALAPVLIVPAMLLTAPPVYRPSMVILGNAHHVCMDILSTLQMNVSRALTVVSHAIILGHAQPAHIVWKLSTEHVVAMLKKD